ncbi:MAG: inositol monophosphatase [Sedimentisphaerales bacterium]|nr:inositol monophosphatase [Sedimentisphaerales bacterium]
MSEEHGQIIRNDELTWVIDPLDGSSYYVRGLQSFRISVALLHQWQPVLGIVSCPLNAEFFTALHAGGSYLNGKPITVSSHRKLQDCIFSFSHRFLMDTEYRRPRDELVASCRSIRGGGSCAQELCYIACGRIDSLIAPAQKIWDFAAGILIVEEAGGQLTNFAGESPDYFAISQKDFSLVASNGHIHRQILESLLSYTEG